MFSVHITSEKFKNVVFTLKTHHMFSVHITSEKFENGIFTLKTHQIFLSTLRRRNLKTQQTSVIVGRKITTRLSSPHRFRKAPFTKCFPSNRKRKTCVFKILRSEALGLKSVFEKLRFRGGLVWTVGLTVEIKLRL